MKHTTFFFISLFLLSIAFFHSNLYQWFPTTLTPIEKFITDIGPEILYIAGSLALLIALFGCLPTWLSLITFIVITGGMGIYLQDKKISILGENGNYYLLLEKKVAGSSLETESNSPQSSPPIPIESAPIGQPASP